MTLRACSAAGLALLANAASARRADIPRRARHSTPPKIDGILDDEAWAQVRRCRRTTGSRTTESRRQDAGRLQTDVRIAYDDRNVYFAFHCFDNEPGEDPHQRRQARRRVQRRLDRDEPRFRGHRPGGVSPVLQSERAARWTRSTRPRPASSSTPTWSGSAPPRPPATATSSRCRSRCRRCASPAATR